jgi:biopolymer transport protein ExbD
MIDVVFLLLVYFLVTSNFAQMERDLSSAVQSEGGGVRNSELQPQIIEVSYENGLVRYSIGSQGIDSKEGLTQLLRALPKAPGVVIRAQRDVPIGAIAAAMQASQDAGFTRRSYVPASE